MHETISNVQSEDAPAKQEHDTEASLVGPVSSGATVHLEAAANLRLVTLVGISLLVMGAYYNSLAGGFVQDDTPQIIQNPMMGKWNAESLKQAFTRDFWSNIEPDHAREKISVYYRPLFLLALMAGHALAGTNPGVWHLIAVCLHLLAAVLAFLVIEKILELTTDEPSKSRTLMAAFATAVFVVHPVQSESTAWISGLVGPLSTVFMLGAFLCYLAYRRQPTALPLAGVVLLFLMATLTKEQTLVLPIIILACELLVFRNKEEARLSQQGKTVLLATMGVAAFYLASRYAAIGVFVGRNRNLNFADDASLTLADQLRTLPALLLQYCKLVVYPADLSLMYAFGYVRNLSVTGFWLPLVAVSGLAAVLIYWARRAQAVAIAAIWIVVPLLPHLNTRAFVSEEIIHDRYLYGSMIGIGIVAALLLWRVSARATVRAVLATLVVLALMGLTVRQNRQWRTDESLWRRAAETAPESRLVHLALGAIAEKANRPEVALAEYESILESHPNVIDALNDSAFVYARQRRWAEATRNFERIVSLTPGKAVSHFNLSFAYAVQKRYDEAAREQQTAIDLDPNGPRADEWRARLVQLEQAIATASAGASPG
ncbi:MAG: tetratricopeptide repeat protein [Acidobacteriota bacterium]